MKITQRDKDRFWANVRVDPKTGCWVWTASVRTWKREPWDGGYGAFWHDGRVVRAHVFAYRLIVGRYPDGLVLLHSCDNRRCVNVVDHIKPGTQIENVREMLGRGRNIHQRRRNGQVQRDYGEGPGDPLRETGDRGGDREEA